MLILSLEEHRHNGETADAGGEEAEEDVGVALRGAGSTDLVTAMHGAVTNSEFTAQASAVRPPSKRLGDWARAAPSSGEPDGPSG